MCNHDIHGYIYRWLLIHYIYIYMVINNCLFCSHYKMNASISPVLFLVPIWKGKWRTWAKLGELQTLHTSVDLGWVTAYASQLGSTSDRSRLSGRARCHIPPHLRLTLTAYVYNSASGFSSPRVPVLPLLNASNGLGLVIFVSSFLICPSKLNLSPLPLHRALGSKHCLPNRPPVPPPRKWTSPSGSLIWMVNGAGCGSAALFSHCVWCIVPLNFPKVLHLFV